MPTTSTTTTTLLHPLEDTLTTDPQSRNTASQRAADAKMPTEAPCSHQVLAHCDSHQGLPALSRPPLSAASVASRLVNRYFVNAVGSSRPDYTKLYILIWLALAQLTAYRTQHDSAPSSLSSHRHHMAARFYGPRKASIAPISSILSRTWACISTHERGSPCPIRVSCSRAAQLVASSTRTFISNWPNPFREADIQLPLPDL